LFENGQMAFNKLVTRVMPVMVAFIAGGVGVAIYNQQTGLIAGLSAFAGSAWNIFSSVVEGIIEVAVVVVPIGLVAYAAVASAWKRYSKTKTTLAAKD
jgi:hypothetical protein